MPVGRACVFASRESLGKTTPPGRCCTPFPSGEQPLAGNCAAGTSVLGTTVRSDAPLWGTAEQHWAQPSSSAALPPRRAPRPNPALGVCATARAVCAQCIGLRGVTHQQKCTCGEVAWVCFICARRDPCCITFASRWARNAGSRVKAVGSIQ